jgi:hypothetical protein
MDAPQVGERDTQARCSHGQVAKRDPSVQDRNPWPKEHDLSSSMRRSLVMIRFDHAETHELLRRAGGQDVQSHAILAIAARVPKIRKRGLTGPV